MDWNRVSEGQHLWGRLSPDKVGFRVHGRILNLENARRFATKGKVSVINKGGAYWDICIHAEGLVPGFPLITQLSYWFGVLAIEGVFRVDVGLFLLYAVKDGIRLDKPINVILYQETLKYLGFIWSELEVAEDYPQHNRPIKRLNKNVGRKYRSTLYSGEGKSYKRQYIDDSGIQRVESKGYRKDLICEYNRAQKIGSSIPLWRIELRLQRHHLDRLSPYDLCFDFHTWVCWRWDRLGQFVRKVVKPGEWRVEMT